MKTRKDSLFKNNIPGILLSSLVRLVPKQRVKLKKAHHTLHMQWSCVNVTRSLIDLI